MCPPSNLDASPLTLASLAISRLRTVAVWVDVATQNARLSRLCRGPVRNATAALERSAYIPGLHEPVNLRQRGTDCHDRRQHHPNGTEAVEQEPAEGHGGKRGNTEDMEERAVKVV